MQWWKKNFYFGSSIILFTEDIKMWTIQLDILEMFGILQLKKFQADILEQDIQQCLFLLFPSNNCWEGRSKLT
jgi:hypothetical protein